MTRTTPVAAQRGPADAQPDPDAHRDPAAAQPGPASPSASPAVTVVVPCYESARTLPATLDSLLAQTFTDLEILVVDDGSVREPVGEVPDDPRIVVDRRPENRGYAAVTNHAAGRARGRWITFVDADDTVEPTFVQRLLEAGERHDADLVVCPLMAVRDGHEVGALRFDVEGEVVAHRRAYRTAVRGGLVLSQHVLLRMPVPAAVEGYTFNDFVLVLEHLARSRRVALVHEPLYRYQVHSGSTTGSLRPSVWELRELPRLTAGSTAALFDRAAARTVRDELEQYVLTQMLHKAAREAEDSSLRRDVYRWCRQQLGAGSLRRGLGAGSVVTALKRRDPVTAASWSLALLDPRLHARAYQAYDRRKDTRAVGSGDA